MKKLQNIFGKKPKKGFKFNEVYVDIVDNDNFKGFDIAWNAQGIGFGHVTLSWGIGEEIKVNWPCQYGFHVDTEEMSSEFIYALMKKAAPIMANIIVKYDRK